VKPSKELSSWLIVLVVLATAGITSWAMLKYKPSPTSGASYFYPPQQVAQHLSPGVATLQGGWQLAAATTGTFTATGAPAIRAGAVAPHTDRGVCTQCHTVVGNGQQPVPPISASSTMPHEYRGVCSNCHRLTNPSQFNANANVYRAQPATQVAAVTRIAPAPAMTPMAAPPALAPVPPAMAPVRTATPAKVATEGEWMGLEVTPITPLTATQYGIPAGTRGLVVAEAEAQAAAVGVKAGDVVESINGMPITQMADFFQVTQNGMATGGMVGIVRQGKRLAINLTQTPAPPAMIPNRTPNVAPAAMQAAMPMSPRNYPVVPANAPATAWGLGQGAGTAGRANPGTTWQQQF